MRPVTSQCSRPSQCREPSQATRSSLRLRDSRTEKALGTMCPSFSNTPTFFFFSFRLICPTFCYLSFYRIISSGQGLGFVVSFLDYLLLNTIKVRSHGKNKSRDFSHEDRHCELLGPEQTSEVTKEVYFVLFSSNWKVEEQLLFLRCHIGIHVPEHDPLTLGISSVWQICLWNCNLLKRHYHFSAETTLTAMGVNAAARIIKSQIFHNPMLSLE